MTSAMPTPDPSFNVPFFRPSLTEAEIEEVLDTLRSGWLTTGPKVKRFEAEFAKAVGADYAIALNSCTAALHLAVEALNLKQGEAVLVPTMTFAATAEIVRYQGAVPVLVDCDPVTLNIDLADARLKIDMVREGKLRPYLEPDTRIVGIIPVHVGGEMIDIEAINAFAREHDLWMIEDAAHAFPASWRRSDSDRWQRCGEGTSLVACYSFYANKTITTGEGGMAVTNDAALADRIRMMSLHGLSQDAWARYTSKGSWDYRICAPGYKYNLTDIAAAIGLRQLERAEAMRVERESIAALYRARLQDVQEIELPADNPNRIHSWHLFPIRLRTDRLSISRDEFIDRLKAAGVGCSVHWRPLHLHPYYSENFAWDEADFPVATEMWNRLISLPIFPGLREDEMEHVVRTIKNICSESAR